MFLNKSSYLGWNAESIQFKDVAADRTFWGEINDNKDGNNDNIFREYIRKTPWSARSTYYDLQRWGKMTISYVQSIVLLLWKLISTTIRNQTENETKGQNKKKRKEKNKNKQHSGKRAADIAEWWACLLFLWRIYQSFRTHGRFALGRFVPR